MNSTDTAPPILVAPSGFKESLDAETVAAAIGEGVRRVLPAADVRLLPLVDGGEGTAAAMADGTGGRLVPCLVTGPVGDPVPSHLGLLGDGRTAVVEMAAAAGLALVPRDRRDPLRTTTYGVGELMRTALDHRVERILVGCGDSGTSDGGAGALQALGARLLDAAGEPLGHGAHVLGDVDRLDLDALDPRLADVRVDVAVNPSNVLTGPRGVARVFGPQKGATPAQVERLAAGLEHWAGVLERDGRSATGTDLRTGTGTGASGGLGAGLAAVGAMLRPRFDVLLDGVDLDRAIAEADLVITAEGSIDAQTPRGKVPGEVARRAQRTSTPVLALAGTIGADTGDLHALGIGAIHGIVPAPMSLPEACAQGAELVADGAERALRMLTLGAGLGARWRRPLAGGDAA